MARIIKRGGNESAVLAFLDTYTPPQPSNLSDEDNRQLLLFEGERAHLYASFCNPSSSNLYEQLITKCRETLGATDEYTIRVRFLYARYLGKHGRRAKESLTLCLEILRDLLALNERRDSDLALCKGQPVSVSHAEIWTRKLVKAVHQMMEYVDDQTMLDQARTVLRQITTSCVEQQQGTQPTPTKGSKRKFDAGSEDLGNRSVIDDDKRVRAKTGPPPEDDAGSDKENHSG